MDAQSARCRRAAACAALLLLALLSGCARKSTVEPILTEQCLQLGGPRQEITVEVPVRAPGLLHVGVRERGISARAAMMIDAVTHEAESPIDRLGTIGLAAYVRGGRNVQVRVSSIDSHEIVASVCVTAELFTRVDALRARALQLQEAAGNDTARRAWQNAFDDYLAAARGFDAAGMTEQATAARHAMAELEYGYMRRSRDSVALDAATIADGSAGDPAILANRLALMARALMDLPELEASRAQNIDQLLRESERLYRASGVGRRELPRLTIFEGFQQYRLGNINSAEELFNKAAASCRKDSDWECLAQSQQNLAAIAEERQNYPAALADYENALRVLDTSRAPKLVADINDNMARLESRIGLIHRSEQSETVAMNLYASLDDCDGARRSVATLGEMLVRIGSIGDAAKYLDQSALNCGTLLRDLRERKNVAAAAGADALLTLTSPLIQSSESRALACASSPALGDLSLQGSIAVFHSLLARSEIARLDGEVDNAKGCLILARTYAVDARSKARLADASGALSLDESRPREARSAFDEAETIVREAKLPQTSEITATTLLGLSQTAFQSGDIGRARSLALSALEHSSSRADVSEVVEALRLLAADYRAVGRMTDAERILRTAVRLIEDVPTDELDPDTRAAYLATQHAVFAELTELLTAESHKPLAAEPQEQTLWNAFSVAEDGHARAFRYALEQTSNEGAVPHGNSGQLEYSRLMHAISGAARNDGDSASAEDLIRRISELSLSTSGAPLEVDRGRLLGRLSEAHATLVEYAAGRSNMFAFVIDNGRIQVASLGDLGVIARAATELSDALRAPDQNVAQIRSSARRLAELVLWPIAGFISQSRVVIVPEDSLHIVPFALLPWSSASSELFIQRAEITSAPSAFFFSEQNPDRDSGSPADDFVLFGDPVLRFAKWRQSCVGARSRSDQIASAVDSFSWSRFLPSLPGTAVEVNDIANLVRRYRPSATLETLLRCEATPNALRTQADDAKLLHIATHGLIDARRPRFSTLALTPDFEPLDDGAIQLLDILRLRLHANLVVLSACDTSRGRLLPGEGVLGLAQTFLQAGARSVLASYWRVGDSATVSFMDRFYRYLLAERLPAATALRRAQLDASAEGDSFGWAAFGLYGQPGTTL